MSTVNLRKVSNLPVKMYQTHVNIASRRLLFAWTIKKKAGKPEYEDESNGMKCTSRVKINGTCYGEGRSSSKRKAREIAANAALSRPPSYLIAGTNKESVGLVCGLLYYGGVIETQNAVSQVYKAPPICSWSVQRTERNECPILVLLHNWTLEHQRDAPRYVDQWDGLEWTWTSTVKIDGVCYGEGKSCDQVRADELAARAALTSLGFSSKRRQTTMRKPRSYVIQIRCPLITSHDKKNIGLGNVGGHPLFTFVASS
ncbi:hypothetical protein F5887DRAFT_916040 [Amanita rubescens]|nr:hypothetical protein F5887DRAFT_916040 [Amanita rubescens]